MLENNRGIYRIKEGTEKILKKFKISDGALKWLFYHDENLPFDPKQFEFTGSTVGEGGSARVYLLENKQNGPHKVIKVFRPGNKRASDPVELARALKKERKDISELYSSVLDLIPQGDYLVMEDPFMSGKPAVALVEEFVGGKFFDIFSSSPEEISARAKKDQVFKNQVLTFIKITLQHELEKGETIDIHGPKNLIVVDIEDDSSRLILLDPHDYIKTRGPEVDWREAGTKTRLDFLKKTMDLIEGAK